VAGLANVDAVFQEIGEWTIGKRNFPIEFPDLGVPTLGDNPVAVKVLDQLAKTLQFQIPLKNIADGLVP
jgi:hypothetical protein